MADRKKQIVERLRGPIVYWLLLVALPSIPAIRNLMALPLVVSDEGASGDSAYVLASGAALEERLSAAVDLYRMGRVREIMVLRDDTLGRYNFVRRTSFTGTQWTLDFLEHNGIPRDRIRPIALRDESWLGTLGEARQVAGELPAGSKRLVVVTSAAHTRRSVLAFRRALRGDVAVIPYSASSFGNSAEMYRPLWIEYAKLLLYALVA